jgi:hypothetical protein
MLDWAGRRDGVERARVCVWLRMGCLCPNSPRRNQEQTAILPFLAACLSGPYPPLPACRDAHTSLCSEGDQGPHLSPDNHAVHAAKHAPSFQTLDTECRGAGSAMQHEGAWGCERDEQDSGQEEEGLQGEEDWSSRELSGNCKPPLGRGEGWGVQNSFLAKDQAETSHHTLDVAHGEGQRSQPSYSWSSDSGHWAQHTEASLLDSPSVRLSPGRLPLFWAMLVCPPIAFHRY